MEYQDNKKQPATPLRLPDWQKPSAALEVTGFVALTEGKPDSFFETAGVYYASGTPLRHKKAIGSTTRTGEPN